MKGDRDRWDHTLSDLPLGSGGFGSHTMKKVKERIKMLERRARRRRRAAAASVAALAIAGALVFRGELANMLKSEEAAKPAISETETTTLNIMFWENNTFMTMYGQPFIIRHPSVRFEYSEYPGSGAPVAGMPVGIDKYKENLMKSHADLVQVPLAYVPELSAEGLLKPLDTWMKRDEQTDEDWNEAVRQTVRDAGGGELYGYAPEFTGFALYYNRKLFKENGIPEPTEGMSWDEVMNLAARFEGLKKDGKPTYGLSFGYYSDIAYEALEIGDSQGLRLADAKLGQASADTPAWTDVWTRLADGHRAGWINNAPSPKWEGSIEMKELYQQDPFLNGRSAMVYASSSYLTNIAEAGTGLGLGDGDWAVLSPPAGKENRGTDGAFSVPYVFAVPTKSANADAAWELLKYIMTPSQSNRFVRFSHGSSLPTVAADEATADERTAVFYRASVDSAHLLDVAKRNSDPVYGSLIAAVRTEAYNRTQNLGDRELDVPALLKALQTKAEHSLAAKAGGKAESQGAAP